MTSVISFDEAADALVLGQIGVIPTDTVYGIVTKASDEAAVKRLYAAKHREHKPGTIIAANAQQIISLGVPARYVRAVEQFWPNAVSVEIPHGLTYLHQGTGRQAFRVPKDATLRTLLERTGPLQTTSANMPGEPTATVIEEAIAYFGDAMDFYVDGGDCSDAAPSTIVRVADDAIEVIRQGAVRIDEQKNIIIEE